MADTSQSYDLSALFSAALQAISQNREQLNALDSNGNHGDNMVENLRLLTNSLRRRRNQAPAEALRGASKALMQKGRGGTSQYYAQGLDQAAQQLEGKPSLDPAAVATLLQVLLSAVPAQGHPGATQQPSPSVLETLAGLATAAAPAAPAAQPQAAEGLLGQLLGAAMGQAAQPAAAPQPAPAQAGGVDVGDVLGMLVPAGLAYMQAKQGGADTTSAAAQAVIGALVNRQANPLQAPTARAAGGGLIAQSILRALLR